MNWAKIKRLLIFPTLVAFLVMLNSSSINRKSREEYRKNFKVEKGKIEYSYGTIYIGSEEELSQVGELKENDYLVLDERDTPDPNLKVYNSFRLNDVFVRNEFLEALLYYEEVFPMGWNRTRQALKIELNVHNYCYELGIKHDSTTDVDFNNADEKIYVLRK